MQDKRIHIDEKFVNQSWAEMRKQLDQEMPVVEHRKRRVLGWWFILAGLLLSAGAAALFLGKKTTTGSENTAKQPIAGATLVQPAESQILEAETSSIKMNGEAAAGSGNSELSKNEAAKKQAQIQQKSNFPPNIKGQKPAIKTPKHSTLQPQFALQNEESSIATIPSGSEKITTTQAEKLPTSSTTPDALGMIGLSAFPMESLSKPDFSAAAKNPYPTGLRYSIQANGMSSLYAPATGVSITGLLSKPLNNSKLSIETGLGLRFLQQPLTVLVNGAVNPAAEQVGQDEIVTYSTNGASLNDESLVANGALRTEFSQGLNLLYLSVPIQANYQIRPRLSLVIGMDLGFLLYSKSDFNESGILQFDRFQTDKQSGRSGSINNSLFDYSATGGLAYRMNRSLGLQMGYIVGQRDVLPDNNVGDFNRMFYVGIRYHFQPKR